MPNKVDTTLSNELLTLLKREQYVLLSTIDHETTGPNVSAISWLYAVNNRSIVFAVDSQSRIVKNIQANDEITITLIGNESTYAIGGKAMLVEERMDGVPLKLTKYMLLIKEVRDVMFYGAKMSVEPAYEKTYDPEAAAKLDRSVMAELKKSNALT
ncbi:pyridoxamine 5'-phosphate oxidase family protein [Guptibacillus hwajinpoensis]|uniref:Nitroimidazol reductase NimA-like FMN-containing flavoprotein (Pyridoxamine 5'-phosphate oxidase superfamily) n=1 Tax=Guptibacillus hwajinpoensis TaxID=208199 RepID=A0ABU0K3M9_9BACL|nr:pyridoxamine 5'-phosphate oxidase family protein [Alkalihalobacillus hemicentroti]MDQ0482742.1 nitroimidazol reductase NimA-like FMN-containing flavoprotein (pyridoxamine 5'-phosphate oxidase superfamily) [Alkalihalobacillus hemicentroti]